MEKNKKHGETTMTGFHISHDEDADVKSIATRKPFKLVGVGGGGKNSLNRLMKANLDNLDYIAANTDASSLSRSDARVKILMGQDFLKGLGTGGRPGLGKKAAQTARDEIISALDGAEMVLISATLGGGTGSGAAPLIAGIAHEMGALVVAFVTRPFRFEGTRKARKARESIKELRKHADILFDFRNEVLLKQAGDIAMETAFAAVDNYFAEVIRCFVNMLTSNLISIDLHDIITGFCEGSIAIGHGKGPGMVSAAVEMALKDKAFKTDPGKTDQVIINITSGPELKTGAVSQACELIQKEVFHEAGIIYTHMVSPEMTGQIRLSVVFLRPRSR